LLEAAGIAGNRRAETLDIADFDRLAHAHLERLSPAS
ncbi:MAG: 16S rRNA (adenine(1518)-N(6)/adenine(1519)-N(6))-dimethyltransferase, partial [Komagataeibacter hansenii]|nr:16S rRNA (adenine(1518)-N(6)/adenine(1519)-N(6))-dimethyltransferase [Novacetimonas hansenii]